MAVSSLDRILGEGHGMEAALEAEFHARDRAGRQPMAEMDRSFAYSLTAAVIRRLGHFNILLDRFLPKRSSLPPGWTAPVLLGLGQILTLRTPIHAVLATTGKLLEGRGLDRLSPVATAVLRRAEREGAALLDSLPASARWPDWFRARLLEDWPEDQVEAIAAACLEPPPLDLSLHPDSDQMRLAEALGAVSLLPGQLRLMRPDGPVPAMPGFAEGAWWVQDAAASLPARLFGPLEPGAWVVDACAAPGGKTMQLAAAGARVTALDRDPERLERIRTLARRLDLLPQITLQALDFLQYRPEAPVPRILLDAPCSATGTLRKSPELPWTRKPEDLTRHLPVQAGLLRHAASLLAPGGVLVYAVCSLLKAEGEAQIESLLQERPELTLAEDLPESLQLTLSSPGPAQIRVTPASRASEGGMDGFFAIRLQRRG